jgi:hypothetical protein
MKSRKEKKREYTIKLYCTKKNFDKLMWWLLAQEIKAMDK